MKYLTKKFLFVICLIVCLLFSAIAGIILFERKTVQDVSASAAETDLNFTLYNNSTEYRVSALNKTLTKAQIPATYKGLPVTEVADNAFTNCTSLTYVFIPYTVTRIGNNAFANCQKLERITGMPKVTTIGNNAFAMCTRLDKLILPSTITALGSTILRNNPNEVYIRMSKAEMIALNAAWESGRTVTEKTFFGNEIVYEQVEDKDGNPAYEIQMCQNIAYDEDLVLYSSYKNLPVINIQPYAFYFNHFNSITIKHDESGAFHHSMNLSTSSFFGVTANFIDIEVDLTLKDETTLNYYPERENGTAIEIFGFTAVRTITLPNSLNRLTRSMFSGSTVREILSTDETIDANHLSSNITQIDTAAFEGCTKILNLYIPSSVTVMGSGVFSMWGNSTVEQTVHIDLFTAAEGWDQDWKGTIYGNAQIKFNGVTVILSPEGGEGGTLFVEAHFGEEMPEGIAPNRDHYRFGGYFSEKDGNGTQYYDENMNSVSTWNKTETGILYAYWIPETYTVFLDNQGGDGVESIEVAFGSTMPTNISAPVAPGKIFAGYYSEVGGKGVKYYSADMSSAHIWDLPHDETLYANWEYISYSIYFDSQGGTGGSLRVDNATYMNPVPAANAPVKKGFDFVGYYLEPYGKGKKYYNADMSSADLWDILHNETLYANWTPSGYSVKFDFQGGLDGTKSIKAFYSQSMPSADAPVRTGYQFKGYYTDPNGQGTQYYDFDMASTHEWDVPSDTTLYAYWIPCKYKVTLYDDVIVEATFDQPMPQAAIPTLVGGRFTGYYTEPEGNGKKYYNADMSSAHIWDIPSDKTLYAAWEMIELTIDIPETCENLYVHPYIESTSPSSVYITLILPSRLENECKITISNEIIELRVKGVQDTLYNLSIEILDRESEFSLKLEDLSIQAPEDMVAISMESHQTLHLYTFGKVEVYGGNGSKTSGDGNEGCAAIICGKLVIHCADELFMKGGRGADGMYKFGKGGNGGSAVFVFLNICEVQCDNVTLQGGAGGTGAPGLHIPKNTFYLGGSGGAGAKAVAGSSEEVTCLIEASVENVSIIDGEDGEDGPVRYYMPNPGPPIPPGFLPFE